MRPLVLFDVDGTLLLTSGAGMRAMQRVLETLFHGPVRWDGIVVSGHLDPLIFAEVAERSGFSAGPAEHERFRDAYVAALTEEIDRGRVGVRALPGVHEVLGRLRDRRDVTLGLLTGNYAAAIPVKLGAVGIDPGWFPVRAFGDEAPSRVEMAALALERYGDHVEGSIDPGRVVVVGDTPRDVECAHANGCLAFGVATGRFRPDELEAAGADKVVSDLSDPRPLIDLIETLAAPAARAPV